jgi:hypothetical protein
MSSYDKLFEKVKLQVGTLTQTETEFYEWQKMNLGCFQEIKYYFASYVILNFFLSVFRVIYMKSKVRKKKQKNEELMRKLKESAELKAQIFSNQKKLKPQYATNAEEEDEDEEDETTQNNKSPEEIRKARNKKKIKVFEMDMFKHYYSLNRFIEQEIYLENSNQSDDVDSTIRHFNQIFVMFTALTLFGMLFPASFVLYYFALLMEVYNDRQEFLFISRRPSPKEMNSIGYFKYFLEICPKLAMITISYFLSFNMLRITLNVNYIYLAFITIFVFGNLLLQVVYAINPKGSEKMNHLIERQEYLSKLWKKYNFQRKGCLD